MAKMTLKDIYPTLPQGWLSEEEAGLLWDTVMHSLGDALEMGTYLGRSAILIASALRERAHAPGRLTCCDPFLANFEEGTETPGRDDIISSLHASLDDSKLLYKYAIVYAVTEERLWTWGPPKRYGFIYVDCEHTYDATSAALNRWLPLCDGRVACHDYGLCQSYAGLKRAVDEASVKFSRPIRAKAGSVVVL